MKLLPHRRSSCADGYDNAYDQDRNHDVVPHAGAGLQNRTMTIAPVEVHATVRVDDSVGQCLGGAFIL
jgi:hypothetical protein